MLVGDTPSLSIRCVPGQGAGMQYLKSTGVANIGLHVDEINSPAIRLYTSVGFEKVGELHWFAFQVESG